MKYLIVGLGNIGREYENTRHNIGFSILDAFAEASNTVFFRYALWSNRSHINKGTFVDITQTVDLYEPKRQCRTLLDATRAY